MSRFSIYSQPRSSKRKARVDKPRNFAKATQDTLPPSHFYFEPLKESDYSIQTVSFWKSSTDATPINSIESYLKEQKAKEFPAGAILKMAALAKKQPNTEVSAQRLKFERLANAWIQRTQFSSSPRDILTDSNYLRIIGMGPTALPFIYNRLKNDGGQWFVALQSITDHIPSINYEGQNLTSAYRNYWIKWLEENAVPT